ncbi:MAG: hypothetical protein V4654_12085 [Bdellovibrionota bacterium]
MTKFLTVMTIFGLFAFKSYALDLNDLKNLAEATAQFKQSVQEMEAVYDKGVIKADIIELKKINAHTTEVLKYCQVIETKFQQKAPEVLTRKQEARNRAIEKAESLLDAADTDLRSAQVDFIKGLETAKYCLGLTSQMAASIRASISQ